MRRLARPLLYGGTVCAVLGFGKYHAAYVGEYSLHDSPRLLWSCVYALLLSVTAYATGLPDLRDGLRSAVAAAAGATATAAIGISLIQLALGSLLLPRFVVFASALVLIPWYALCAAAAVDGRGHDEGRDRVLAIVGPAEAVALEAELGRAPERPASLVGILDPAVAAPGSDGRRPVVEWARAHDVNVIVLDRLASSDDGVVEQVALLHERGEVRVRTLTLFYDDWLGKLPVSELERVSLMFDIGELHRARYSRIKRLFDVAIGLAGVGALAAVVPFVLIGNWFGNRGPLFFFQERLGRSGHGFTMVKFRTMHPVERDVAVGTTDASEVEVEVEADAWTCDGDARITRLGQWLRRSHLDELPQAWNVLRGDLALVGPRPEQRHYVVALRQKIPFYDIRHVVRPGLTGWAQVKYAYGSSVEDAEEKLQYEFWYLRHQNLVLDARIVARTIRAVVGLDGR